MQGALGLPINMETSIIFSTGVVRSVLPIRRRIKNKKEKKKEKKLSLATVVVLRRIGRTEQAPRCCVSSSTPNNTTVYDGVYHPPFQGRLLDNPRGCQRQYRTIRLRKALGEMVPTPTFLEPPLFQLLWRHGSTGNRQKRGMTYNFVLGTP